MLKNEYITIIEKRVQEILEELDYHDKVIRDDIFKLLRKKTKKTSIAFSNPSDYNTSKRKTRIPSITTVIRMGSELLH